MNIQKATSEEDFFYITEALQRLFHAHQIFDTSYKIPGIKEIRDSLAKDDYDFIAFDNDGARVGFIRGRLIPARMDAKIRTAILHDIYVEEDLRDSGIGKMLLKSFTEEVKKAGVERIELQVDSQNEKAIQFWEQGGFKTHQLKMAKDL